MFNALSLQHALLKCDWQGMLLSLIELTKHVIVLQATSNILARVGENLFCFLFPRLSISCDIDLVRCNSVVHWTKGLNLCSNIYNIIIKLLECSQTLQFLH